LLTLASKLIEPFEFLIVSYPLTPYVFLDLP
jgi:hypothetical protein